MSDWDQSKAQVLARLKRAEGQVRAVAGMVEREEDCEKVAQQLAAARKALDKAFYDLVACMTQRELAALGIKGTQAQARLSHMTDLLARYG
ncbi:MAG: metal-sensing transcriptional repressor [Nevskiaceae bacterium]|nr:MAG: metal-sensing transcriptional repressor [Nevskiaceae bacterium]